MASHDGVGSLLYHHTLRGHALRSVPRDNEAANETWLSDRDRYSVHGLYAEDRVLTPRLKENGEWREAVWDEAIAAAADALKTHAESLGVLMSPSAASEEYFLAARLARSLGSNNIDHRLREADFRDDAARAGDPVFGMSIADMETADSVLLVGSNIRHEAPILGHRLRKAWKSGAAISTLNPIEWAFKFDLHENVIVAPQQLVSQLAGIAGALVADGKGEAPEHIADVVKAASVEDAHRNIAASLASGERSLVLLGQAGMSHPDAALLRALAGFVAQASGAALNLLPHGANSVGAWRAGAVPHRTAGGKAAQGEGLSAAAMLAESLDAYMLWGVEPEYDFDNPAQAVAALKGAKTVVAVSDFASGELNELADVILPLAPVAESEGTFVNLDGSAVSFAAAGKTGGEARPGWKILRRLGAALELDGFSQVSLAELNEEMTAACAVGEVQAQAQRLEAQLNGAKLCRVGEVPLYSPDALCRRSTPLQGTVQAESFFVGLSPADAKDLGLAEGDQARVRQASSGDAAAEFPVRVSEQVPQGAVWLRSATCGTRTLGTALGAIEVEKA